MRQNKRLRATKRISFRNFCSDVRAVRIKTETNKAGVIKKLIIGGLIGLQLAFIIYLNVSFAFAVRWWMLVCFGLSLINCVYVLSSNRNGLSKAVWIIFLLVCFSFATPIFWLSDERIFFRKAKKRYKEIFDRTKEYERLNDDISHASTLVKKDSNYLYVTGKFSAHVDSDIKYFSSGSLFFDDVLEQIKKAEKFIFIEFFIVSDGVLLDRFFDILSKKVKQGVDVRLIYDDMGSKGTFSNKAKKRLKNAGIKLKPFNKLIPLFLVGLNYRDHRKIVSIDGKIAYTGGSNLADEYVNEKRMHGYWKDTGVKIVGKAVDSFTLIFLRQWEALNKIKEDYGNFLNLYEKIKSPSVVIPYADGPEYDNAIGRDVYQNLIANANEFIYVMTPYFIIDDGLTDLIINKALSGVDVRIVLPGVPDKAFVYSVTRSNAEKLIDYGVKIYVMTNSFVHSKIVISENATAVGSVNMDLRSFYQQFECSVYTDDANFNKAVIEDFTETFDDCTLITDNNMKRNKFWYRFLVGAMQLIAPFM